MSESGLDRDPRSVPPTVTFTVARLPCHSPRRSNGDPETLFPQSPGRPGPGPAVGIRRYVGFAT